MLPDRAQRIKKLTLSGAAVVCAGFLYGYILVPLGLMIPCPFHLITGLQCPGCGVSRMCIALMHFRFREAAMYNLGLALCLPVLALLLIRMTLRYVRDASWALRKWEHILTICLIIFLLVWAVLRNIWGI